MADAKAIGPQPLYGRCCDCGAAANYNSTCRSCGATDSAVVTTIEIEPTEGCRICAQTDDATLAPFRLCLEHRRLVRAAPNLLKTLERLNGALTPYLEALRTSHLGMNRIEQAIYDAAIEARAAIAKTKGAS